MSEVDSTSLIRTAQRFADLDHVSIGLSVLDSGLRVLFWNRSMEYLTGIPRETALGQPMARLNPEWEATHYPQRLSHLFEGGPPVVFSPLLHPKMVPGPREPGLSFHVKATAVPDDRGGWWAFLSVEDVTILSRRVEELRNLRSQQERMMKEIHHRVKNNLNMISGLITLQKSQPEASQDNRSLDDLQSRIVAISEIHDALYRSSSFTAGSTGEYLANLARLLDKNLSLRENHTLNLDLDPAIVLKTDTTALLGMIQAELLTNALKYGLGRQPGEQLTVRLSRLSPRDYEYQLAHSGDSLPSDFDPKTSSGLGMVLLTAYAAQLGTSLEWARGDPTRFWLRFSE